MPKAVPHVEASTPEKLKVAYFITPNGVLALSETGPRAHFSLGEGLLRDFGENNQRITLKSHKLPLTQLKELGQHLLKHDLSAEAVLNGECYSFEELTFR